MRKSQENTYSFHKWEKELASGILKQSKTYFYFSLSFLRQQAGGIPIAKMKIIRGLGIPTPIFKLPGGFCTIKPKMLESYFTNIIFNN